MRARWVAEIAGLPLRTLANWIDWGIASCAYNVKGTGNVRRFDLSDVVRILAIKRLRNAGLSMQALRAALDVLRRDYHDGDPLGSGRLLVVEERPFYLQGDKDLVDVLKRQTAMQPMFLVDLGEVAQEARGKVEALQVAA